MKNNEIDFPFYKEGLEVWEYILMFIPIVFFTVYSFLSINLFGSFGAYVFCLSQLIIFLIIARGRISKLISKPKFKDYIRVIVTLLLQYIFVIIASLILKFVLKLELVGNSVLELDMGLSFWITVIFQLFGEELYKILIFLVVLSLMYKLTKKRKLSIVVGTCVSLLLFGLIHYTTYYNIIHVLVLQGIASYFCMYNYLKTKNILTSYLEHLLLDAIPFILAMLNVL